VSDGQRKEDYKTYITCQVVVGAPIVINRYRSSRLAKEANG